MVFFPTSDIPPVLRDECCGDQRVAVGKDASYTGGRLQMPLPMDGLQSDSLPACLSNTGGISVANIPEVVSDDQERGIQAFRTSFVADPSVYCHSA